MKKSRLIKKSTLKLATNYIATPSRSHNEVVEGRYKTLAKSSQRTSKQKSLISEINKYKRDINKRLKDIKRTNKMSSFTSKIASEMQPFKNKNISKLNERKLTILRNRLKYVNNLKSTTEQGNIRALKREENYKKRLDKVINKIRSQNPYEDKVTRNDSGAVVDVAREVLEKVESLYNKLVEENGIWEKFRYEIIEDLQTLVLTGYNDDEILSMMDEKIQSQYEEYQEDSLHFEWTYF